MHQLAFIRSCRREISVIFAMWLLQDQFVPSWLWRGLQGGEGVLVVKHRAAGEAPELLPCPQATAFGLSASVPQGGNALERSSCHLVPFRQGEVTSPVHGDRDHVAMPWSGNWACVLLTVLLRTLGLYICHNHFTARTVGQRGGCRGGCAESVL